jgi:hypothetical protein
MQRFYLPLSTDTQVIPPGAVRGFVLKSGHEPITRLVVWLVEAMRLSTNLFGAATPAPVGVEPQKCHLILSTGPSSALTLASYENFQQVINDNYPRPYVVKPGQMIQMIAQLRNDSAANITQGAAAILQILELDDTNANAIGDQPAVVLT